MVFKKKIEWRRRDQITVQVGRSRAVLSSWGRHRLATIISKGHACYAMLHNTGVKARSRRLHVWWRVLPTNTISFLDVVSEQEECGLVREEE